MERLVATPKEGPHVDVLVGLGPPFHVVLTLVLETTELPAVEE